MPCGLCLADDNVPENTPNAHGQINVGQPRKPSAGLFGDNGLIQRKETQRSEAVHEEAVKIQSKSRKGHRITAEQAQAQAQAEVPQAPAERIVLVPTVEDNGHGVQVTVYKKYIYKN